MQTEIQDIMDICQKQGISQDAIHEIFEKTVSDSYTTWIHQDKLPQNISILIDLKKGIFRILQDEKDITTQDFVSHAEKSIRKELYGLLSANDYFHKAPEQIPTPKSLQDDLPKQSKFTLDNLIGLIYWFYNGSYILFVLLALFVAVATGSSIRLFTSLIGAPPLQIILVAILLLTPLIAVALTLNKNSITTNNKITKIFFLFEIPTIIITSVSLSIYQNTIPFVWILLIILISTPALWVLSNIHLKDSQNTLHYKIFKMVFSLVILVVSIYLSLLLTFFIPVWIALLAQALLDTLINYFSFSNILELIILITPMTIMAMIYLLVFVGVATVITSPFFLSYKMLHVLKNQINELLPALGKQKLQAILSVTLISAILISVASNINLSGSLLGKLDQYSTATFEDKLQIVKQLQDKKEALRSEIESINHEYAKYIFIKEDNTVGALYEQAYGLTNHLSSYIEALFDVVSYPLSYQGTSPSYTNSYSTIFEQIFGEDYYKTRYGFIKQQPIKNVTVESRTAIAHTTLNKRFATITIEESYRNKTYNNQEVIYEFTLPENSVMTDLKLGNNLEYQGLIAPRGAAERVFNQEVTSRQDPALLEQTGPRHYRLRVFPIPSLSTANTTGSLLKVSYTYLTPLVDKGYALPSFTKKQNIEDKDMGFLVTFGQNSLELYQDYINKDLPSLTSDVCSSSPQEVLAQTASFKLLSSSCDKQKLVGKITFIYDVSHLSEYKNIPYSQFVDYLKTLSDYQQDIEVYLANESVSTKMSYDQAISLEAPLNFGLMLDAKSLGVIPPGGKTVIITSLADGALYKELVATAKNRDIYIVSQSGFPALQQSEFIQALQRNIVFVDSLDDLVYSNTDPSLIATGKGWRLEPITSLSSNPTTPSTESPVVTTQTQFIPRPVTPLVPSRPQINDLDVIGTNAFITREISKYPSSVIQTAFIDTLYKKAQANYVVSAYSSLIALVNLQQLNSLQYESEKWDRYSAQQSAPSQITDSQRSMEAPQATTNRSSGGSFGFLPGFVGSSSSNMAPKDESSSNVAVSVPTQTAYVFNTTLGSAGTLIGLFVAANVALIGIAVLVIIIKRLAFGNKSAQAKNKKAIISKITHPKPHSNP